MKQAELNSMNGMSMDATKLLTEKLAMARELSTLKPEVDHLRSQVAVHQSLLAEKLSLQRQLNTFQVELEMEKRATQRALAKEGKSHEHDTRLEDQLEELRREVAKERRERQKVEREAQKELADWEGKKTILEGRLDAFRNKLRLTKDQLKEAQNEPHTAQTTAQAARVLAPADANIEKQSRNPRKRSAGKLDKDAIIGTPGDLPVAKKSKKASTLPGDKSTFSITPFLNRTASVPPELPLLDREENEGEDEVDAPSEMHVDPNRSSPAVVPPTGLKVNAIRPGNTGNKPDILVNAKSGKANAKVPPARKQKVAPALEKVAEEDQDENMAPTEATVTAQMIVTKQPIKKGNNVDDTLSGDMEGRKKRRRLLGGGLGKTLFDDDDGEGARGADKGHNGGATSFGGMGRAGIARSKGGLRLGLGGSTGGGGFGTFSPLKKDRMASAAS